MKNPKRQLALLLALAMTLTMLQMPVHAIVEETAVKPVVSKAEISTDTANKPV